jgi:hypothetical protein
MPKAYVTFTHNSEEIEIPADSNKLEFLNIEEDVFGRDNMTFEYDGKEYTALVYTKGY